MQGEYDTGRFFRWGAVTKQWPRRLLHIPTMTSLQRQDGNIYGGEKEPAYSILTYTWGRWEVAEGPRLDISGTSWKIPAIDARHFSVEAFQHIINLMGKKTSFAWVDVACIDQKNDAIKMDEIGRQVGIFANAEGVYLWLSHLTTAALQSSWTEIFVCSRDISKALGKPAGAEMSSVLQRLEEAITTLLGDPWFSSLWTLQEGILRRDAVFLSREAEPIVDQYSASHFTIYLYFLSTALYELRLCLVDPSYAFEGQPTLRELVNDIVERIERAGFTTDPFSRNPNVQYTAAKHRQTSNKLDRIYGIMSIYDVRVGGVAGNASVPYTLDRLEDEFAAAINAASPAIGQLFIHIARPKENRTWRITQNIRVPEELSTIHKIESDPHCLISATSLGHAAVVGKICPLFEVFEFLEALSHSQTKSNTSVNRSSSEIYFSVLADDYLSDDHPILQPTVLEPYINSNSQRMERGRELVTVLLTVFGRENVSVLLLGQEKEDYPKPDQSEEWVPELNIFGLIIVHDSVRRDYTRRLGVCVWYSGISATAWVKGKTMRSYWQDFKGQLF